MKLLLPSLLLFLFTLNSYGQTINPPMPIYPANKDTITELYPVFSWAPVYPLQGSQPIAYSIRIVEVLGNQTPEAAIQANPDYFAQSRITQTFATYPLSAPYFRKDKRYAWQVIAHYIARHSANESMQTVQRALASEVYSFVSSDDMSNEVCIPFLFQKLDNRFYVVSDYELKFNLKDDISQPHALRYRIVDSRGREVTKASVVPTKSVPDNYYSIALRQYEEFRKKLTKGKFFVLEAAHPEGQVYKLRFTCN